MRLYDYIKGNKDRIDTCCKEHGCQSCSNSSYCDGLRRGTIILTEGYNGDIEYILGIKHIIDGYIDLIQLK